MTELIIRMIALGCGVALSSPLVIRYLYRRFVKKSIPDPDRFLDFQEMCAKYGFETEKHEVVTADHYILTIFRVLPRGPPLGEVLFLQHGLSSSADAWVCNGPELSPVFILAARGFEVWVGNSRGNHYSKANLRLLPDMKAFWEFSFVEMGRYDLPASIGKALQVSQVESLHYIGTS